MFGSWFKLRAIESTVKVKPHIKWNVHTQAWRITNDNPKDFALQRLILQLNEWALANIPRKPFSDKSRWEGLSDWEWDVRLKTFYGVLPRVVSECTLQNRYEFGVDGF